MAQDKKEKVGIWMHPDTVKQIDATYPLHEIPSRSEFVCRRWSSISDFCRRKAARSTSIKQRSPSSKTSLQSSKRGSAASFFGCA